MKDYSNYRKYINVDMVDFSGKFHFNEQLRQEGCYIEINGNDKQIINDIKTPIRAIIRNYGVENKEGIEERSIMIGKEYLYKTGDYIKYLDDIYITTASVDKDNPFFNTSKMTRCNHNLKFMVDGQLYTLCSIAENNTKYTLGTKVQVAGIVEGNGMFSVKVPYNLIAKKIRVGQRFLINGQAWKATQTDYTTTPNLLNILLGEDNINVETDDIVNGIADAWVVKHDYKFDYTQSFSVTKDKTYNLVYSFTDNGKDIDSSLISIENTSNLIEVNKTGNDIVIKGLSVGTGSIKLKVKLTNETKEFNIDFSVKAEVVNQINYDIKDSNGYEIKQYEATTLTFSKLLNGVVQSDLKVEYELDSFGQSLVANKQIIITQKGNNVIWISNEKVNTTKQFVLTVRDSVDKTIILNEKIIKLVKGV